jgi:branched-chain amino acid transport system ATP-binding protein
MDFAAVETASLSYGRQRLLEIAVAVAGQPTVLLLDEPAAGIPEGESAEILAIVGGLPRDVTVLLIEHDMDLVFAFAERISVLVGGAILAEGTPDTIRSDPRVRAAYLGEGDRG